MRREISNHAFIVFYIVLVIIALVKISSRIEQRIFYDSKQRNVDYKNERYNDVCQNFLDIVKIDFYKQRDAKVDDYKLESNDQKYRYSVSKLRYFAYFASRRNNVHRKHYKR